MPSANETALTEILREFGLPACNEDAVAQYLASRGVLVPAALSEADARLVVDAAVNCDGSVDEECAKRALERLARGEAAA